MKDIDYDSADIYELRGQWSHRYGSLGHAVAIELNPRMTLGDRVFLALGLWAMLGLVALVVLASRYLAPVLVTAVVLFAIGMKAAGVV